MNLFEKVVKVKKSKRKGKAAGKGTKRIFI